MKRCTNLMVVVLVVVCLASHVAAVTPHRITYQGRLTDGAGIPVDTSVDITFRIYETDVSMTPLWSQMHGSVLVQDGLFSAILSSFGDMAGTFDGSERWLSVQIGDGAESNPRVRIESSAYAYRAEVADTAAFAFAVAGGGVSHWTLTDGVLYSEGGAGVARGEAGNDLRGDSAMTHVNLGTGCITGSFGQLYPHITVSGGRANLAAESYAVVAGGRNNSASDYAAVVGGGATNTAAGAYSVVSGGTGNSAGSTRSGIGGGESNIINGWYATIAGGKSNNINGQSAFIGGGENNSVGFGHATVGGGYSNSASGQYSAILGGYDNTIAPGANYSYLFGIESDLTEDSTFMVDMPHIRFGDETTGYEFPTVDGSTGQVMVTDGLGQLAWDDVAGGISQGEADARYVNIAGDVMYGNLEFDSKPKDSDKSAITARVALGSYWANLELYDNDSMTTKLWGAGFGKLALYHKEGTNRLRTTLAAGIAGGYLGLRDNKGSSIVSLDASLTGDASVALPEGSISDLEIRDEPGISQGMDNRTEITGQGSMVDVAVTSITIPTAGYIVISATGQGGFTGTQTENRMSYQIDETAGGSIQTSYYRYVGHYSTSGAGAYYYPISASRTFYKSGPGTFEFRLEAKDFNPTEDGSCWLWNTVITAVFYPTSYGTVSELAPDPGDHPDATALTVTDQTDPSVQTTVYEMDLRYYELKVAEAEAAALKAKLELEEVRRTTAVESNR